MTKADRTPLIVTGRELNRVLDERDAIVEKAIDALTTDTEESVSRFKVETVERLNAFAALQEQIQSTLIGMLGAIRLSNTLQPAPESQDVRYFVEDQGFMRPTNVEGFERARQAGQVTFRQVTTLERYDMDPELFDRAREIIADVREIQG